MKVITKSISFFFVVLIGAIIYSADRKVFPSHLVNDQLLESPFFALYGVLTFMIVAAILGFIRPKAFWLWGFTLALSIPIINVILTYQPVSQGLLEVSSLGLSATVGFVVAFNTAVFCTLASASGAGARIGIRKLTTQQGSGVRNGEAPR